MLAMLRSGSMQQMTMLAELIRVAEKSRSCWELIRRLMAGRELVVQPGAHLVEGGGQGIELVRCLRGRGRPSSVSSTASRSRLEFLGVADDAVDMTDHQVIDDDQDAEQRRPGS